jgi:hypothetical protein
LASDIINEAELVRTPNASASRAGYLTSDDGSIDNCEGAEPIQWTVDMATSPLQVLEAIQERSGSCDITNYLGEADGHSLSSAARSSQDCFPWDPDTQTNLSEVTFTSSNISGCFLYHEFGCRSHYLISELQHSAMLDDVENSIMILEATLGYLQQKTFDKRCIKPESWGRDIDITKSVFLNSFLKGIWDEVERDRAYVNVDSSKVADYL